MSMQKRELQTLLEAHYRTLGWKPERAGDGTVRAAGIGGVTWIGLPVITEDLDSEFEQRLLALADVRMEQGGELCPLEVLPAQDCVDDVRAILDRLRLRERGHVEVYSLAA